DPALPPAAAVEHSGGAHAHRARLRHRSEGADYRTDGRRDGSADRRGRFSADNLRHGQGRRSSHGNRRHPPGVQERRPQRHLSTRAMNVLVGTISHAAAWVIPRAFVEHLRQEFPQHTIVDAWDVETIRRLIPEADVAFVPHVDRAMLASAPRLRWIQSPAVGVGAMLYPEMIASPVVITIPRGIRARAIAEHVLAVSLALARQLHTAIRRPMAHTWAQDELQHTSTSIIT